MHGEAAAQRPGTEDRARADRRMAPGASVISAAAEIEHGLNAIPRN